MRFVIFAPDELKALQESPSHTIEIVAFIPDDAMDRMADQLSVTRP